LGNQRHSKENSNMVLTMQSLQVAISLVKEIERSTGKPIYPTPFNGVDVICDPNCLADTAERNFAESKHRSKRIRKKLIKRFGSEFKRVPAMFQFQGRIVAHPVRYAELKRQFSAAPPRSP
jgi:hypothetical protein